MTTAGPIPPHPPHAARSAQGQAEFATDRGSGARDMHRGGAGDSDQRRDDRFSKALQKAMAVVRPSQAGTGEGLPAGAAVWAPPLPGMIVPSDLSAAPAARTDAVGVAERIDRYLRGAEGAQSLKDGQSMVVKLPPNALGVTSVVVQMRGDVLHVTIGMQAAVAAEAGMQAQLALLGQTLSLRQPKHAVRVLARDEEAGTPHAAEREAFNPLIPRGRAG